VTAINGAVIVHVIMIDPSLVGNRTIRITFVSTIFTGAPTSVANAEI
jgi:hypothetical protein